MAKTPPKHSPRLATHSQAYAHSTTLHDHYHLLIICRPAWRLPSSSTRSSSIWYVPSPSLSRILYYCRTQCESTRTVLRQTTSLPSRRRGAKSPSTSARNRPTLSPRSITAHSSCYTSRHTRWTPPCRRSRSPSCSSPTRTPSTAPAPTRAPCRSRTSRPERRYA